MKTIARTDDRLKLLQVLLVVGVVESFIHYLDNTLRFRDYAGPNPPLISSWIPQWFIPVSWVMFTVAGLLGYLRYRERDYPTAAFWIGVYSISGLISLLHYAGISVSDLSVFQNTFVFADIALGAALMTFALTTFRKESSLSARSTS